MNTSRNMLSVGLLFLALGCNLEDSSPATRSLEQLAENHPEPKVAAAAQRSAEIARNGEAIVASIEDPVERERALAAWEAETKKMAATLDGLAQRGAR
jgi:hypothetical protein